MQVHVIAAMFGCVLLAGCSKPEPAPIVPDDDDATSDGGGAVGAAWFADEAESRGLAEFVWASGHVDEPRLPEIVGGGAALFDMDNDGDLDAYLVQAGVIGGDASVRSPNELWENDGSGQFARVDVSGDAGDRGYGMGVACGDYDGDGDTDVYVTNLGPNVLLRNDGDGVFADVTEAAGVGHAGFGTSATFFDYDRDGDLDLFFVNYVNWSPESEIACRNNRGLRDYCAPVNYNAPSMDVLYRNDGDGSFTDVSLDAGLDAFFGNGLGVAAGDFTNDGWPDLFVANDGNADQLWVNQGNGRFVDQGRMFGVAYDHDGKAKAGMGVTVADIDQDQDLDVLVCNLRNESDSFYRNEGHFFRDSTAASRLMSSKPFTRFGMGWIDFDNDGWLDLYQANGKVMDYADSATSDPYAESNVLMRGLPHDGVQVEFAEVLPRGGVAGASVFTSRCAAFGDVDNDGRVDVLVINRDAPANLLMNATGDRSGHFVGFRVLASAGSDALGAVVTGVVEGRTIRSDVRAGYSYLASNDPRVFVGLGSADAMTDVSVLWPDGVRELFGRFEHGQVHEIRRGSGQVVE